MTEQNTSMVEIVEEQWLGGQTWAFGDANGELTIVTDISLPEAEQTFVHLDDQAVHALAGMLDIPV
jgi:hypothetical protein